MPVRAYEAEMGVVISKRETRATTAGKHFVATKNDVPLELRNLAVHVPVGNSK